LSLTIKNKKTYHLARELAEATGESITQAVTIAVRERLERTGSRRRRGTAARLLAIGADCAAHLKEPFRSTDHETLLCDGKGLPR
jgi:antitoxin VapB